MSRHCREKGEVARLRVILCVRWLLSLEAVDYEQVCVCVSEDTWALHTRKDSLWSYL